MSDGRASDALAARRRGQVAQGEVAAGADGVSELLEEAGVHVVDVLRPGMYVGVHGRLERYQAERQLKVEQIVPLRVELDRYVDALASLWYNQVGHGRAGPIGTYRRPSASAVKKLTLGPGVPDTWAAQRQPSPGPLQPGCVRSTVYVSRGRTKRRTRGLVPRSDRSASATPRSAMSAT